ncbi:MAG: hypothetical protein WBQ21_13615 [Solirubrobacteraceae bacterium]
MGFRIRVLLLGTVACAIVAFSVPGAQAAGFEVEKFVAANCSVGHETCGEEAVGPFEPLGPTVGPFTYSVPKEPTLTESKEAGYTQAAGHPAVGITAFKIATTGSLPAEVPTGAITHIRTDVAPGVSTNPEAMAMCTMEEFDNVEVAPETFLAPKCKTTGNEDTEIGKNYVTVYVEAAGIDVPIIGTVYNLQQPVGRASDFGVALPLPAFITKSPTQLYAHTLIEGGVEWGEEANGTGKADYHDYYEINVSPKLPVIASRLLLYGDIGDTGLGGFITNPSNCSASTKNTVTLQPEVGQKVSRTYTPPIGTEGCKGEAGFKAVPFEPAFSLQPATTQSDQPDGVTAELSLPHAAGKEEIDSSQLENASITMPEGMTLNPSGAQGLLACTPAQARIHSPVFGTGCPEKSEVGSVVLDVPDLPAGSLTGKVYLGGPESGPITGPPAPYVIYVNAESTRYGVDVRLQGEVTTNEATGRVTATFVKNPEQPFSKVILTFKGGALAPIANPLICGLATSTTSFSPYTGTPSLVLPLVGPFTVDGNGQGGACASPLPFALTQTTASVPTTGGAATSFTLNLGRADGQQYLSNVSTALPTGLVGKIPAVPLCPEPQASLGTCSSTSQIGTATATVGSGPTPVQFSGPVYLTGPTGNAPYGMTTVINAAVGPFSLGNDVVRTGIEVNQFTARVTVAGAVPTIFKGIPLRLKALSVAITTPGFLVNPTNCGALATETTLTSSLGAKQTLSTPFQATNCSALAFKPKFTASSNGKTSRANGAALNAKVSYPTGLQSNIKSVVVTVPKQLPSRLTTLSKACLEKVFDANPYSCPTSSRVGGATVTTPVLPGKLTGPAIFVSHGGRSFPDLDFLLTGNGVTVVLVGNTNIQKGITTTTFASLPDVPISGFEENLPTGKNSAVTAIGNICQQSLVMPTTITGQNGKVVKQNTKIAVSNCPVTIVSHAVRGNKVIVTVKVPAAGRVSGGGTNLKTVYKHPGKSQNVTLEVPLKGNAPLATKVRVGFIPKAKGQKSSTAYAAVLFR